MSLVKLNVRLLIGVVIASSLFVTVENDTLVRADITCYDFVSQAEAQAVYDALPNDPFIIDSGWPEPNGLGGGDQEAGNAIPCDEGREIPDTDSPGNEKYKIGEDSSKNGKNSLPEGDIEQATIQRVVEGEGLQTVENPSKLYAFMSIATPEFEQFANYEGHGVPGQCGADLTSSRIQELLPPGTTIWLEIDEAGFFTRDVLDRHVWIKLDGRFRLVSEVLITEGLGVTATERPGTGKANAADDPPPGSKYRDALRRAQARAIDARVGIWSTCGV